MLEIFKVDKGVASITIDSCGCHSFFLLALLFQLSHILWFLFSADTISLFAYDNEEGLKSKIKSWSKSLFISSFTILFLSITVAFGLHQKGMLIRVFHLCII